MYEAAMDIENDLDMLYMETLIEFVQRIRQIHGTGKVNNCIAYHIAAGSGIPQEKKDIFFDFEEPDSILTLLETFLTQHKPAELALLQAQYQKRSES